MTSKRILIAVAIVANVAALGVLYYLVLDTRGVFDKPKPALYFSGSSDLSRGELNEMDRRLRDLEFCASDFGREIC
jgi:hypothetical protein